LGVGLRRGQRLSLGDLPGQVEVAAVRQRDLGQRAALLRQRREPGAVGRDRRVEQRGLDLLEPLVVGLEFLEHARDAPAGADVGPTITVRLAKRPAARQESTRRAAPRAAFTSFRTAARPWPLRPSPSWPCRRYPGTSC